MRSVHPRSVNRILFKNNFKLLLKNWEGAASSLAHTGLKIAYDKRNKKLD